jgi:hypothetical protein
METTPTIPKIEVTKVSNRKKQKWSPERAVENDLSQCLSNSKKSQIAIKEYNKPKMESYKMGA